ncbi:cytochrome c oxidase subunit II [Geomonas anaerohicana]|uniref:Cytochrome c oxidase subunit 2 n=1 Tax=Geomonas anaerohicana TaxID=2798583 RepID=A0ABS0Y8P9_9BACT|nr:cytochrome c oxidase subunit II [Geomonas anaerohicana]MBJ6748665.1 cytochrome c oxidase subunit II [Geomonas anaerohicana]
MENQLLTTTQAVDPVFKFLFGACTVLLLGITITMIFFVVRYRRSKNPEPTSQVAGSPLLEVVWTLLPTLLVIGMFYYGWTSYLSLRTVPKNAMQVTAEARMWSWSFVYDNGKTSPKLYVPVGRPVQVNLVSKDVVHGFYVPAFRIKRDVVPGMKNHVWFVATTPGSYDLFCSQYCGTAHSSMVSTVEALPPEQFAAWLGQKPAGVGAQGQELLQKYGCLGCHSLDGTPKVGPTFKGLYDSQVKVTRGGKPETVKADEKYLRESIVDPGAAIVEGFPPIMPKSEIPEAELKAIVEFLEGEK